MKKKDIFRTPVSAFFYVPVYLAIFALGLQFSYYLIFSSFPLYDDEGTMLLHFQAFFEDTRSYNLDDLPYGPFHYLFRYALYSILNVEVSHDINRLMTIAFWGLIAAVPAFFVHRVIRSFILAAVVQIFFIFDLQGLRGSPGLAQETALLLIVSALFISSCVGSQRYGRLSWIGLGATLSALLLVKINIGIYLGVPLALSMLLFLPRHTFVRYLLWLTSVLAMLLPVAIMWKHVVLPSWDRNYCIWVTLAIAACLIAASRNDHDVQIRWSVVGITVSAMFISMVCILGIIVAGGGTVQAIAEAVILRPLKFSYYHVPFPIADIVVYASIGSVLLALSYRFVLPKIANNKSKVLAFSLVKLAYGSLIVYSFMSFNIFHTYYRLTLSPFLWIVLVEPYGDLKPDLGDRFPRVFLCLLAAFQTLQAYPVAGAQATWALLLLYPVAIICIGDTLPVFWAEIKRRWPKKVSGRFQQGLHSTFMLLILCLVGVWFYQKAQIGVTAKNFSKLEPLNLPGASKIHLPRKQGLEIRRLVNSIRSHCDGFVGLPGMPSLYFWTQIRPPGLINDYWVIDMAEDRQHEIINVMEQYERPCVIYNPQREQKWLLSRPENFKMPLVNYIHSQFTEVQKYGNYSLRMKNHAVP